MVYSTTLCGTLGYGFLAESAMIGSAIVLVVILISVFAATLTGLLLIPMSLVIAIVVALLGYIVAAYALGVGHLTLFGRSEPGGLGSRVLAAATGALILKVFRPTFYVSATSAGID